MMKRLRIWNENAAVTTLLACLAAGIFFRWCATPFSWVGTHLLNFRLRGMRLR